MIWFTRIPAPANLIGYIIGMETASLWLITNPEELMKGAKTIARSIQGLAKAVSEAASGGEILANYISTRDAADIHGVELHTKYYYPLERKMLEGFPKGTRILSHICSREPLLIGKLRWYPPDKYAVIQWNVSEPGKVNSLEWAKKTFGEYITLSAGFVTDTEGVLSTGTPEQVFDYTKYVLKTGAPGGRFILGHGCHVPSTCREENIRAVWKAIEKYGSYPPKAED